MDKIYSRAYKAFKQLNLKLSGYKNKKKQDQLELAQILVQILDYPTIQKGERHKMANQLGNYDLYSEQNKLAQEFYNDQKEIQNVICQCCGLIVNKSVIPYCTSLDDINLGLGTRLYFNSILLEILVFFIATCIYSIYTVITNLNSCILITESRQLCRIDGLGLRYKIILNQFYQNSLLVSSILGLVLVAVWGIVNIWKNIDQKRIKNKINQKFIQASSFTIMMKNVPMQYIRENIQQTHHQIQKIFKQYQQKMKTGLNYKIAKINIARNLYVQRQISKKQYIDDLALKYQQKQNKFKKWIQQRQIYQHFSVLNRQRLKEYQQYEDFMQKQYNPKIIYKGEQDQKNLIFVTFENSKVKEQIVRNNSRINLFNFYQLCQRIDFPVKQVTIRSAPPPEQIIWFNIGFPKKSKYLRLILVFTISILFIAASLAMTYGLNKAQEEISQLWVSFLISIVITIVNFMIQFFIMLLSRYPKQSTQTDIQFNIALTVGLFESLNIIGVPLIALYISKRQLYGQNGLSSDIFFIGLLNIATPLARLVDPYYLFINFRNWLYSSPNNRLHKFNGQSNYNKIFEDNYFDLGYEYVYLVKTSFFTSFFLSLQPSISFFAIIGFVLFYFINKYRVLYRFMKPKYNSSAVNSLINYILNFCPMIFAIGTLVFTNWQNDYSTKNTIYLNWISFIIAGAFFCFPFRLFYKFFKNVQSSEWKYSQKKAILPSEYDRMNPVTKQQAIQLHQNYLSKLDINKFVGNQALLLNRVFLNQSAGKNRSQIRKPTINNNLKKSILRSSHKQELYDGKTPQYNDNVQSYMNLAQNIKSQPNV